MNLYIIYAAVLVGAVLLGALGVQSYRLQGARAEVAELQTERDTLRREAKAEKSNQEITTRKTNEAHTARVAQLQRVVTGLHDQLHISALLSAESVSNTADSGDGVREEHGTICFARDGLRAGLAQFDSGAEALIGIGAGAISVLETCATWAVEQHQRSATAAQ